jgi:hypothetical protein
MRFAHCGTCGAENLIYDLVKITKYNPGRTVSWEEYVCQSCFVKLKSE